jgi:acetyl esterase/lipase
MSKINQELLLIRPFLFVQKLLQRNASIEFVRRISRWSELMFPVSKKFGWEKFVDKGLSYEWLIPRGEISQPVILYLHGGFVFPLYNPTRYLAGYLAQKSRRRTLLVDFRLAPEHPFPAAVEDCAQAYRWLITDGGVRPEQVVIIGESAGGNLAITSMLLLRDTGYPLPAGSVLISPAVDFEGSGTFYTKNDPMADAHFVMRQLDAYRGGADPRDPLLSPLYADLAGLPPLLLQIGSEEILRSGVEELAKHAKNAGVEATLEIWPGMWHYWHIFISSLPPARQAMDRIVEFLQANQNDGHT